MATIQINENTKIGKSIVEMLKVLSNSEEDKAIKFLDETGYLLASEKNREALQDGIQKIEKGEHGKQINVDELWK